MIFNTMFGLNLALYTLTVLVYLIGIFEPIAFIYALIGQFIVGVSQVLSTIVLWINYRKLPAKNKTHLKVFSLITAFCLSLLIVFARFYPLKDEFLLLFTVVIIPMSIGIYGLINMYQLSSINKNNDL